MLICELFPSKFLNKDDVTSQPRIYTIRDVIEEDIDGRGCRLEPVVYFEECDKGFVLKKTNALAICEVLETQDTEEWRGRAIALRWDRTVQYMGKVVGGIRVVEADAAAKPVPATRTRMK